MNIHINDNQTEATINGVEYLLTPKETTESKPETYTIDQLKSEKIAVRCENWEQAQKIGVLNPGSSYDMPSKDSYPIKVYWDQMDFDWIHRISDYLHDYSIVDFSQVQFPEKRESKKALFKTEDGVEIYEGDYFFRVDYDNKIRTYVAFPKMTRTPEAHFKHRDNALQYISDNKPEYSKRQYNELLDDLLEAFQQACWIEPVGYYDHMGISTWKRIQLTLIEAGKIKAEECYRQV